MIPAVPLGDVHDLFFELFVAVVASIDMNTRALQMGNAGGKAQALSGGRGHQAVECGHPIVIEGLQHAERRKRWAETRSRPPENIRHSIFPSRFLFALL